MSATPQLSINSLSASTVQSRSISSKTESSLLVSGGRAGGASGDGGGGDFPDMVTIFNFLSLTKSLFWECAKNKEESKFVNVS